MVLRIVSRILFPLWMLLAILVTLDAWLRKDEQLPGSIVRRVAFHGGVKERLHAGDLRGGHIVAVGGSFELDLRDAQMAEGVADIRVDTLAGRVYLLVPDDWCVQMRASAVLSSLADDTGGCVGGPTLTVHGLAVLSTVRVAQASTQ